MPYGRLIIAGCFPKSDSSFSRLKRYEFAPDTVFLSPRLLLVLRSHLDLTEVLELSESVPMRLVSSNVSSSAFEKQLKCRACRRVRIVVGQRTPLVLSVCGQTKAVMSGTGIPLPTLVHFFGSSKHLFRGSLRRLCAPSTWPYQERAGTSSSGTRQFLAAAIRGTLAISNANIARYLFSIRFPADLVYPHLTHTSSYKSFHEQFTV